MAVLVKNGKIVNHDRSFKADVLCVDGKIVEVGTDIAVPENCQVFFNKKISFALRFLSGQ